jgi:hypothetical protein
MKAYGAVIHPRWWGVIALVLPSVSCTTRGIRASDSAPASTDIIREFLDDAARTKTVSSLTLKDSERWLQLWIVDAGQVESSVGYVLAQQQGTSHGVRVRMNARHRVTRSTTITPCHGWPAFWQRLHEMRAFTIRDESELGKQSGAIHGIRVIFEHREHGRTYYGNYNNP